MREDYNNPELEKQNLKEFNELCDLKDFEDKGIHGNWRYFQDDYGNKYRWYVQKQADGKFHGKIWNRRSRNITTHIKRVKKKMVIRFMNKKCNEANNRFYKAQQAKRKRQEIRDAAKPKFTKEELQAKAVNEKIRRLEQNIKKNESKIKASQTRIKNYRQKIKYHQRRLASING